MKNLKLTVLATALAVVFSLGTAFAQGTSLAEEVEASPKSWNVTIAVNGNATFGSFDKASKAKLMDASSEQIMAIFTWKPDDAWKLGVKVRAHILNKSKVALAKGNRFDLDQIRLFAERTGILDTDLVGSKLTLRLEPQARATKRTRFFGRFDVTLPLSETFGVMFRDEAKVDLYTKANNALAIAAAKDKDGNAIQVISGGKTIFHNSLEVHGYFASNGFLVDLAPTFFQGVNSIGNLSLGMGTKLYVAYSITDSIALGWYTEAMKTFGTPFTFGHMYSELELAFTI